MPRGEAEAVGEGGDETGEGGQEANDLASRQAVAGEEDMGTQGHHEGRRIEKDDAARGRGQRQAAIDEEELEAEEETDGEAPAEGAVRAAEADAAPSRPEEHEEGSSERANPAWKTGETPVLATLIATWLSPQLAQSRRSSTTAPRSRLARGWLESVD